MIETYDAPELVLVIKPVSKMRFRYQTEKGSHGVLTGCMDSSVRKAKKVYPTVQLKNYFGTMPVYLKISLYTIDELKPHVLYLYGRDCDDGVCTVEFSKDLTAVFLVSIGSRKKDEVLDFIKQRKEQNEPFGNDFETESVNVEDEAKSYNQNAAKLCFEAYTKDDPNTIICRMFSDIISNSKSTETGDLKICRLSKVSGSCSGGDEVFLFCDKVKKENVRVHFYEERGGEIVWEDYGTFSKADWHHQVALVFKTPAYKENEETQVWIELQRTTDGATSEPREFRYIQNEIENFTRKRKRLDPPYEAMSNFNPLENEDLQGIGSNLDNAASFSYINTEYEPIRNDVYFNSGISDEVFSNLDFTEIFNDLIEVDQEPMTSINELSNSDTFNLLTDRVIACGEMDVSASLGFLSKRLSSLRVNPEPSLCQEEKAQCFDVKMLPESTKVNDIKEAVVDAFNNGNIESMLRFPFNLMSLQDRNGDSLLHLAVAKRGHNLKFLSKLLERTPGRIFNHQNKKKKTPLHIATETKKHLLIKLLLKHGGMPTVQDSAGDTCIHIACKIKSGQILSELLSRIKNPAELSMANYEGLTAMHISVIEGAEACLKLLTYKGANLNVRDKKSGKTPLHFAMEAPYPILKFLLLQSKVDKTLKDFCGRTIFNYADENVSTEHKMLIKEHLAGCCKDNKELKSKPNYSEISNPVPEMLNKASENWKRNEYYFSSDDESEFSLNPSDVQKLCNLMDPPCSDWRRLGMLLDFDEKMCDSILKLNPESPTKALLSNFQKKYPQNQLDTLKKMLKAAELHDAASTLKCK